MAKDEIKRLVAALQTLSKAGLPTERVEANLCAAQKRLVTPTPEAKASMDKAGIQQEGQTDDT